MARVGTAEWRRNISRGRRAARLTPRSVPTRTLLWRVVDAALEQPAPTRALSRALNAVLERTESSRALQPSEGR